jgi:hypothetical protein
VNERQYQVQETGKEMPEYGESGFGDEMVGQYVTVMLKIAWNEAYDVPALTRQRGITTMEICWCHCIEPDQKVRDEEFPRVILS